MREMGWDGMGLEMESERRGESAADQSVRVSERERRGRACVRPFPSHTSLTSSSTQHLAPA
jgi:hypothetical protein